MTLLEVGCGWGATMQRAMEKYDVNVIGLTLSKNQQAYCRQAARQDGQRPRTKRVLLQGWEQFHEPVDRIVSIEAFEHFGYERYDDFFKTCLEVLPDDGRMTLHTSSATTPYDLAERGKKLTFELARFIKFIITEIFPGGRLPSVPDGRGARREGRVRGARGPVAAVALHSRRSIWADALEAHKDEAIAIQSKRSTTAT